MKSVLNVLIVFLALVSMIGFASAACADENQTIMLLSSGSNAHGALWNQEYNVKICYDDDTIFGDKYFPTDATPHACTTGSNNITSLTGTSNAHASSSLTGAAPYSAVVCHKGLKNCETRNNEACPEGKKPIVYLSDLANAHLSKTAAVGYNYVMCCENTTTVGSITPVPPTPPATCGEISDSGLCGIFGPTSGHSDPLCASSGCTGTCTCFWEETCKWKCESQIEGGLCRCTRTPTSEEACDETTGMKIVNIRATITPILPNAQCPTSSPDCQSGPVPTPCGFISADLPFFGVWQFALSLVAVLLIYILLGKGIKRREYS